MNTMEYVEATRTGQNSLGLIEAIRQAFWGANNRMEMSAIPAQDVYEIRPREDRDVLTTQHDARGALVNVGCFVAWVPPWP